MTSKTALKRIPGWAWLAAALLLLPVILPAQATPLNKLFDKYYDKPGFETQEIIPGSTSFEWEKEGEDQEIRNLIEGIESIRVLTLKDEGRISKDGFWKKVNEALSDEDYKEFLTVNSDDEQIMMHFLLNEDGKLRELSVAMKGDEDVKLITITGDIDMGTFFSDKSGQAFQKLAEYYGSKHKCDRGHESEED